MALGLNLMTERLRTGGATYTLAKRRATGANTIPASIHIHIGTGILRHNTVLAVHTTVIVSVCVQTSTKPSVALQSTWPPPGG